MPRRPTGAELVEMQTIFPQLSAVNVWITDAPTGVYNCIAFSLGLNNQWINPPQPLASFQALYNGPPYSHPTVAAGAAGASIDGWALPMAGPAITQMTHGSRTSTAEPPPLWESKLGGWYRITHGRTELLSSSYGRVVTSFNWAALMAAADPGEPEQLQPQEVVAVQRLAAAVPDEVRERFAAALSGLRTTWSTPQVALSSDTRDYAAGAEFEALAAVGPEAVPLVLEQLATTPDGFFLLPLLERWTQRDDLVAASSDRPLESQQSRAVSAVREALTN
jgi:hypothetical protein